MLDKNNLVKFDSWSEFKKYIDGTYAMLAFVHYSSNEHYTVQTELAGGFYRQILLLKNGGPDVLDFENNFMSLPPRIRQDLFDKLSNYIYLPNGSIDKIETIIAGKKKTDQFNYNGGGDLLSITTTIEDV